MPSLNPLLRGALALVLMFALPACSYVASLFPDKQKQYRYSSEIPELEIPPDLTSSTIEGARQAKRSAATEEESVSADSGRTSGGEEPGSADSGGTSGGEEPASTDSERTSAEKAPAESSPSPAQEKSDKSSAPSTTLAQGTDDVPLIEIEEPFAEAWNDTSRALGRLRVEISDQNRSDGMFYVYYGGDKKYKDRGMLGDLVDLLTGAGDKPQEFRIKLEERSGFTNIYVLEPSGKAVSNGPGFDLLQKLNEKLQNLDKPETEQADSGK